MKIGALGEITFCSGCYVYIGSAQKNLRQRIERHLRKEKRLFWHIDYLLDNGAASVVKVFYREGDKAQECIAAKQIARENRSVLGFGCSDCFCKSHLFQINCEKDLKEMLEGNWHRF